MYKDKSSLFPGRGGGFIPRWSWLSSDDSDRDAFERVLSGLTFPEDDLNPKYTGKYEKIIKKPVFSV